MGTITRIEVAGKRPQKKRIRVAAYARVSTGSEDQLLSLEIQKEHYEHHIKSRPEWEYAGLYYDEGISGTKIDKRDGIKKLLKDCEDGKIDKIITKSISRFSRSTTDCLEMVRKLSRFGIFILFEKENIDTEHMSSELMLSILSSIAESESRSISQNSKWSCRRRCENGTYVIACPPYGYKNENKKMVVIPEQARVVQEIFRLAISGEGCHRIAKRLNEKGIPSKKGSKWSPSSVQEILKNEKYTGAVLLQKTYTDDNFKRHANNGERNQYFVRNHHEAIVSHEIFEKAAEAMHRRGLEKGQDGKCGKYQNRYCFSSILTCGECGAHYKRRQNRSYITWVCTKHLADKEACRAKAIKEEDIKATFNKVMAKLRAGKNEVLKPLIADLKAASNIDEFDRVQELENLIEENGRQQDRVAQLMSSGYIDSDMFKSEMGELKAEAEELTQEKKTLAGELGGSHNRLEQSKKLLKLIERSERQDSFDEDLFKETVKDITVASREELVFNFRCGLSLKERMVKA